MYKNKVRKKNISIPKTKCKLCKDKDNTIDISYKNANVLLTFVGDKYKIKPSKIASLCRLCQKRVIKNIKRSRELSIIPYISN